MSKAGKLAAVCAAVLVVGLALGAAGYALGGVKGFDKVSESTAGSAEHLVSGSFTPRENPDLTQLKSPATPLSISSQRSILRIRNGWIKTSCSPLRKQTSQVKTR